MFVTVKESKHQETLTQYNQRQKGIQEISNQAHDNQVTHHLEETLKHKQRYRQKRVTCLDRLQ